MQIGNRTARSEWNIGAAAIFNDRVVRSLAGARTAIEWGGAGQRKCDNVARMRLQRPSTYNSVTDSHPRDSASYRHAVIEQSCFYQIVQLVFRVLLAIARISREIHATPLETITDVLYIAGLGWNAKRRWPQLG